MANQHSPVSGITLPPFPGLTFGAAQPAPRKTPLEAYQESRIQQGKPDEAPKPETRAAIDPALVLAQLRNGPKTAAAIAKALKLPVPRISTSLNACLRKGQVIIVNRQTHRVPCLWALPGKAGG